MEIPTSDAERVRKGGRDRLGKSRSCACPHTYLLKAEPAIAAEVVVEGVGRGQGITIHIKGHTATTQLWDDEGVGERDVSLP